MNNLLIFSTNSYVVISRMMWAAGLLASISSITYPAISAFVSMHSDADKQGLFIFVLFTRNLLNQDYFYFYGM